MSFISEDCRYEDMIYTKPFVGRQAIRAFFEEQTSFFKDGLDFVIDEISGGSSDSCGLTWHVEFQGKVFPNSRGCSYYRCAVGADGKQQIVYGRDMVESALKPGSASLVLLRFVAALFKRFPKLLDVASSE
ncbi:hypothetical protein KFL_002780100 [Klebsormidium nitens]|uniref:SnoaL-like domain-containing protein n=1 Tax=Klebsormidium nitens TaxID=105231 RepID=A0A1Y1IC15_KLENI|nr:hypothetical protein KFL_002780100 [Klebsormidium nitens]|eukprot:GAQ86246.1 hypothetical protein KFL_002780100 [Klebsormidium nitens]